jgi:hypothetical protein
VNELANQQGNDEPLRELALFAGAGAATAFKLLSERLNNG